MTNISQKAVTRWEDRPKADRVLRLALSGLTDGRDTILTRGGFHPMAGKEVWEFLPKYDCVTDLRVKRTPKGRLLEVREYNY